MDMSKNADGSNRIIRPESKLLIGIGDSFCAGAGTESYELWEKNNYSNILCVVFILFCTVSNKNNIFYSKKYKKA